jgi:hypothetical protein
MRIVPVFGVGAIPSELLTHARTELGYLSTLNDVLRWAKAQNPPRSVVDIITQDEYTHDVIMPFNGDYFLVFDAT